MADVSEREKIARAIEKTSESICKKHRALKTGRIDEGIALNRHFKPLIEPLRLFADSPGVRATKRKSRDEDDVQPIISTPRTKIVPTIESLENVFEMMEDSLATKVQNQLQTSEGREALRAGLSPLNQKYLEGVLRGARDKESGILVDHVYGVYLSVSQKIGTIAGLVDRAVLLLNPKFHLDNLCFIIKVLLKNDYPLNFKFENINNCLKKIIIARNRKSVINDNRIEAVQPSRFTVPFVRDITEK
ncbi:hypothetical protein ALC56_14123 [Trachymyrmex septentrionalis]|uniref:Helix-turn-helix domain-containing protein n=1 Tax=Trachymyrmex septentrionalis TaxID=34720 RepID=A0A195EUR6_9HYME|nr:hypothetical protein ALC56_14123 [Trachymyrmex septentrionalis]